MRLISQCFNGVSATVPAGVVTGETILTHSQATSLTDARIAQSGDMEHEDNRGISKQALKTISGGDPVLGEDGESVPLSISPLYTTNSLPSPNVPDMWARPEGM